jgi:hypothetical protein
MTTSKRTSKRTSELKHDHSFLCNTGEHAKCDGLPPTPAMARFLPTNLRDKACACSCHKH